jgi:hypothetical protein
MTIWSPSQIAQRERTSFSKSRSTFTENGCVRSSGMIPSSARYSQRYRFANTNATAPASKMMIPTRNFVGSR